MTIGEFVFLTIYVVIALIILISCFSYKIIEYSSDYVDYNNVDKYEYVLAAFGWSIISLIIEFIIFALAGLMCGFDDYIFSAFVQYIKSDIFKAMAIISILITLFIRELSFIRNGVREEKNLRKIAKEMESINKSLSIVRNNLFEVQDKLDNGKKLSENLISELENNKYVFKKQEETLLIRLVQLQNMKVALGIKLKEK